MAVPTRAIQGKVVLPSGAGAPSGSIEIELSTEGLVLDGAVSQKATGKIKVPIGTDGAVSFVLIPNDAIEPSGTYYVVNGTVPGDKWTEYWDVPSGGSALDIGAVPVIAQPPAAQRLVEIPAVTTLPTPSAVYANRLLIVNPTDGSPSYSAICLSNGNGTYRWDIFGTGGA